VEYRNDLMGLPNSPVIGEIPLSDSSEAILNLRTNLLLGLEDNQKVIMIVSESEGDGKTYISNQLTDVLKQAGKSVKLFNKLRSNWSPRTKRS
jgi:Mrp family chromosome partitioning ATPase